MILELELTQEKIGEKIGWSETQVANYNKILTPILELCKTNQIGRVSEKLTNVIFDFTEGWFRTSGLYNLNSEHQMKVIEWFINDKK